MMTRVIISVKIEKEKMRMPRAVVTHSLSETLRAIRLQNKIPAKALATHIGKSPAYVSKLENGYIQTIDMEELYSILQFISGDESPVELADQIYKSLQLRYTNKDIEEQLWFVNYDTVKCLLPIPGALVDDFNSRINCLKITRQYLAFRINANEALSDTEKNDPSIPVNQWYHPDKKDGNVQGIKIRLPEEQLGRILDKEIDVAPYVFIFCILFYLKKIEKYHDNTEITEEQNSELMRETTDILSSHRFYSVFEKNRLIAEKQSQEEILNVLSSFDKANNDILNEIIIGFRIASEQNIKSTNEQLSAFSANMHWDLGFMLKIISIGFSKLEKTSVSNKKKLLNEIEALVVKYCELSDDQNRIETY